MYAVLLCVGSAPQVGVLSLRCPSVAFLLMFCLSAVRQCAGCLPSVRVLYLCCPSSRVLSVCRGVRVLVYRAYLCYLCSFLLMRCPRAVYMFVSCFLHVCVLPFFTVCCVVRFV